MQIKPDPALEARIVTLLGAHEFKDERKEIVGMGERALPSLLAIFSASTNDEQVARIMVVLREIQGTKDPFLPKVVSLSKSPNPLVQSAAIITLGHIGTPAQARVVEEIAIGPQYPESARINAARALARIGAADAIAAVDASLRRERDKPTSKAMIGALEAAAAALRKRHGQ